MKPKVREMAPLLMVVNDNMTQLTVIASLLEKEHYTVRAFHDAETALAALVDPPLPVLIITDLHMPGIDGWRFCRLLRSPEYKACNQTPILVISATFAGEQARRITADLGANAFMPAPFSAAKLTQQVQALLAGKAVHAEIGVLIIEDDDSLSELLREAFQAHGFKVHCAATGARGQAAFHAHHPDIVVVDFHLPDVPGDRLLKEFKRGNPSVAVVMMTGDTSPSLAVHFMRQGASAYVRKPFSPEYLITLCDQVSRERALLGVEDLLEERTLELRESEEKYRLIFDNDLFPMSLVDRENLLFLDVNQACSNLYGYARSDLLAGMRVTELWRDAETNAATRIKSAATNSIFIPCIQQRRKDGTVFPAEITGGAFELRGRQVAVLITHDISERKQAEIQLRKLSQAVEQSSACIVITDVEGQVEYVNSKFSQTTGYALAEVQGRHPRLLQSDETSEEEFAQLWQTITGGHEWHGEFANRKKNGERYWEQAAISPVINETGHITHFVAVKEDITQRNRAEEETHRLTTAIEQVPESVVITDVAGKILYVNPAFERNSGYSRAEMIGQNPRVLKSGKHAADFYRQMWQQISAGEVWRGRFINQRKDGQLYTEDAAVAPVRDGRGVLVNYIAVKRDITRELRQKEQYLQAQRMESLGQLAGGVAHDFNNLLTVILGNVDLAAVGLPDKPVVRGLLDEVRKSAERAAGLTRQLLAFARRQVIEPRLVNINELIDNLNKMLHRLIGEDIQLISELAAEVDPILADPGQLEQMLLNLAVNARDAMPEGGTLSLRTENVTVAEAKSSQPQEVPPGNYVRVSVGDTGMGMTQEVQQHVFEPFFTTKEPGKGTGLGLATCFGMVQQNNGHIHFHSQPGQGTTFKIYFPRVRQQAAPPAKVRHEVLLPRGTENILLVEDEVPLRQLVSKVLRGQGYTVLEAANVPDALAQAKMGGIQIQLLLTDVVMPGLSGTTLARKVLAIHPAVKVLFISGYISSVSVRDAVTEPGALFLQKPFTPAVLVGKVREALDAS